MADLEVILASGDITDIKQDGNQVIDTGSFDPAFINAIQEGLPVPIVLSANAANGTIFFDPNEGQIRYKSPAGILLRFRMQTV